MKRVLSSLLAVAMTAALLAAPAQAASYRDVPSGSALAAEVRKASDYGLMQGYTQDRFGYAEKMTRAQFVTVLSRMLFSGSDSSGAISDSMAKTMGVSKNALTAYWSGIEKAAANDVIDTNKAFRPNATVTRGEMAEMLVRALGLKSAASIAVQLQSSRNTAAQAALPFTDVSGSQAGYILVAYDIGMTKGTTATTFSPNASATRAQAAAMLVRIYEKMNQKTSFVHGFYAISSYSQLNLSDRMDAVSAGWSRMTWDGSTALLSTTNANGNEFCVPTGYQEVVEHLASNGTKLHLEVYMDVSDGVRDLLASASGRNQAVEQIIQELTVSYKSIGRNPYSGVTIDFEGLRSASKADFSAFLRELSGALKLMDKTLYVCVSPEIPGSAYYDGYDYRAVAVQADKIILMAHDYDARDMSGFEGTDYYKTAAPAPIGQVYWSLRAVVNEVADDSKIVLGYSCKNVAWRIDSSGKLVSAKPVYPTNDTVLKRLADPTAKRSWSDTYQTSALTYSDESGSCYFLYYQDARSVQTALRATKLLGVNGVSLWRMGTIPNSSSWSWSALLK